MNTWIIQHDVLQIADNATTVIPSTDDIYGAAFEGAEGLLPPLSEAENSLNLSFSRYPASVRAVIVEGQEDVLPGLEIEIETQAGEQLFTGLTALQHGHVVVGNTWYPLAPDEVEELRAILSDIEADESRRIQSFHALLTLKQLAATESLILDRTTADAVSALRYVPRGEGAPNGITASLYPYQLEGWNWLRFLMGQRVGALLADEMGLGKTLQVISTIADPHDDSPLTPTLVVAPGSLLENWKREFQKFAPDISVLKHQGRQRTGRPVDLEPYDIVITSYDTVIRDESLLMMIPWRVIVADEAQNIKNPEALRTQSIKRLKRDVSLAMTGTPFENRLEDLWSVMDFALPGYLGTLKDFNSRYNDDLEAAERLEPLISPLMLRRRVANVAQDLPERVDIPQILELSDAEIDEYEAIREKVHKEHGRSATLVALTSLRQFCAHPCLVSDRPYSVLDFTKMERLREILEEIFFQREKVLIFTSYTEMADIIANMVRSDFGVFAECLDGRLPIDDRQPLIDRFSSTNGPAALVLNPRAGGAGLNITAANHVVHYNLEWNPSLEDQASARAHRRGQTMPVFVHRLLFGGTVEEVVNDRIQRKRTLSDAAVVGVEGKDGDYDDILAALERSPVRRSTQ